MKSITVVLGIALVGLWAITGCTQRAVEPESKEAVQGDRASPQKDKEREPPPIDVVPKKAPKDTQPPKSLPQKVRLAWVVEGAFNGWVSRQEIVPEFRTAKDPLDPGPGKIGEVPGFKWYGWKAGSAAKLPEPDQPFGLSFGSVQIDDAGLKELAVFKKLHTLILFETKVTDAGLKELAAFEQLQLLDLGSTQITDVGLKEVSGLQQLRSLFLYETRVTDAGLKNLKGLKQLQLLDLSSAKVTDAGLKELAGLKQLDTLVLYKTEVTDAGLKELAVLERLQFLHLEGTRVTDVGLKELAGFRQLRTLVLRDTKVTDAGVGELQKALPNLKISR